MHTIASVGFMANPIFWMKQRPSVQPSSSEKAVTLKKTRFTKLDQCGNVDFKVEFMNPQSTVPSDLTIDCDELHKFLNSERCVESSQ
jgi:hypothetical protein